MQKLISGVCAFSMLATVAAIPLSALARPAPVSELKLAAQVSEPRKVIIDGKLWTCEGDTCRGVGEGLSQPLVRECARTAKVLGPVVSYRKGDRQLQAAGLSSCNANHGTPVGQVARK